MSGTLRRDDDDHAERLGADEIVGVTAGLAVLSSVRS